MRRSKQSPQSLEYQVKSWHEVESLIWYAHLIRSRVSPRGISDGERVSPGVEDLLLLLPRLDVLGHAPRLAVAARHLAQVDRLLCSMAWQTENGYLDR